MSKKCYLCDASLSWRTGTGITIKLLNELHQMPPEDMGTDDRMCGKCHEKHIANTNISFTESNQKSQKASNSGNIMIEKYTDMKADNVWLHRIANETAKTNALLTHLIDLYLEDNPRKSKPESIEEKENKTKGAFNHIPKETPKGAL